MKKYLFFSLLFAILIPFSGYTAWVDPGCDPSASGPFCADIAAPIHTSTTSQTKEGALTIQDTLTADDLIATVSVDFPADSITDFMVEDVFVLNDGDTMTGDLNITGDASTEAVLSITNSTGSSDNIYVNTSGSGSAIHGIADTGSGVYGVSASSYGIRGTSTSGVGVSGYSATSRGISGSSGASYGIQGTSNSTYAGVYGYNTAGAGIYGRTEDAAAYGVYGCYNGTNCGYLGGGTFAGYFEAPVNININHATEFALSAQNADHGGLYATSENYFGVQASSVNSTGVISYSENGDGIFGQSRAPGGAGIHGENYDTTSANSAGVKGDGVWGVYGNATASYGLLGCYNSGNCANLGGQDFAGLFDAPIKIENTDTTRYAIEVVHDSSSIAGIGTSNPSGFGIEAHGGGVGNYAVKGCQISGANCGFLGGQGLAGYFDGSIKAETVSSNAITGVSTNAIAITGKSDNNVGIFGESTGDIGVEGTSVNTYGVRGYSDDDSGVLGEGTNHPGVEGHSTSNVGVYGYSDSATSFGIRGCGPSGGNCASLGGSGVSGDFDGHVDIEKNLIVRGNGITLYNGVNPFCISVSGAGTLIVTPGLCP